MNLRITHPALHRLLWQRASAKIHNLGSRLFAPKRWFINLLALSLAFVWLSQILFSVFFRAPSDPGLLAERIALGMLGFTIWQVTKVIFRKPVEPFEWTPCELQILKTAPIDRPELIGYRLLTTVYSVLLKAACFVLVMMPDLNFLLAGFAGSVLGLAFCEFVKTAAEVVLHGTGKRGRLISRMLAATGITSLLVVCIAKTASQPDAAEMLATPAAWKFLLSIAYAAGQLTQDGCGAIIASPFRIFSKVMLTQTLDTVLIGNTLNACALAAGSFWAALNADRWMVGSRQRLERRSLQTAKSMSAGAGPARSRRTRRLAVPRHLCGIGSLAWRQFLSAWHYRSSIFFSFLLPVILCCVPLFAKNNRLGTPIFLVASVAFYSYLLLPAALMLDFRRDVDRLALLKTLPVSTIHIVIGQLIAPVVLCSVFQGIVFLIAASMGATSATWLLLCWVGFIPMNLMIMAFENLIFLLHPYRRNKEGIDVFLRTILTFTGKGLVWGAGAALVLLLAMGCNYVATQVLVTSAISPAVMTTLLLIGVCSVLVISISTVLIGVMARLFDQYDPASDAVAMN